MECLGKAIEAKETALKKMLIDDFQGGRNSAVEAKKLLPQLEHISQILAVCDVHCSAQKRICGSERDWYEILQVERLADEAIIKKQYKKLALLLHPDKNKFPGAEAAFKLIAEANMVLSDINRRVSFDSKHRASVTAAKPKAPPCRGKTSSVFKKAEEVKNMNPNVSTYQFNKANHQQPTIPDLFSHLATFSCPLCKCRYPIKHLQKVFSCPNCFKENVFSCQVAPPGSNQDNIRAQDGNTGSQSRSNVNPGKKFGSENVKQTGGTTKVDAQSTKFTNSHLVNDANPVPNFGAEHGKQTVGPAELNGGMKSKVEDTGARVGMSKVESANAKVSRISKDKNRKRKLEADSSENTRSSEREEAIYKESKGNSTASLKVGQESINSTRRSSRQRNNVSYNESIDNDDDFMMSPREKTLKDAKVKAANAAHAFPEVVVDDYPDPEFSDFDKIRNQDCLSVNQVWACYDTVSGMPRFYAQIRKVHLPESKLGIAWLEADPEKQEEIDWVNEDLPVSCGKYVCADTEETIIYLTLSHQVRFEKGNSKDTYIVYPRKGETWALFKDWDIGWSSEPDTHRKYKFDIVEILSDFCHDTGIKVGFLEKIEGFLSLFQQTSKGAASVVIPSSELLRFSHQIPSFKMTGSEGACVPRGSFELDPAALPTDPNDL